MSLVGWACYGVASLAITIPLAAAAVIAIQLYTYQGIASVLPWYFRHHYQQIDSLHTIRSIIQPRQPLPPMGGVRILPDFANLLVSEVLNSQPKTIVEFGSGLSTVLTGYCLEKLGSGRIHSFDHLEQFANVTRAMTEQHGLADVSTVNFAPLKPIKVEHDTWPWYDTAELMKIPSIDMLLVDGPPAELHHQARYPALPILYKALSEDAVIIIDDAARPDDRAMIDRWLHEFPDLVKTDIPTEKGATILRRRSNTTTP